MPTLDVEALIASQQTGKINSKCQTCSWISRRPKDEQAKWDAALADRGRWTHAAIYRAMGVADPAGPTPGRSSVEHHRASGHKT